MDPIKRAYEATLDVDAVERTVVATINTDAVDRYKTVIVPDGGDFTQYRSNPVVLRNHNQDCVIGKNQWIKASKGKIVAKTKFLPLGLDPDVDKIFELYRQGFLRGWSVFGTPIDWGRPTPQELRKRPEWANAEIVYRKWILIEYSAVTLPGNADALTQALERGLSLSDWPATLPEPPKPKLPPLIGRSFDEVLAATLREVALDAIPAAKRAFADAQELARGMV